MGEKFPEGGETMTAKIYKQTRKLARWLLEIF